jgi:hypothetical protein
VTEPKSRPFNELAKDALSIERRIEKGVNVVQERERYALICNWIEQQALNLSCQGRLEHHHHWGSEATDKGKSDAYLELTESFQHLTQMDFNRIVQHRPRQSVISTFNSFANSIRQDGLAWLWSLIAKKSIIGDRAALKIAITWQALLLAAGVGAVPFTHPVSRLRIGKSFYPPGDEVQSQRVFSEFVAASLQPSLGQSRANANTIKLNVAVERALFYRQAQKSGSAMIEIVSIQQDPGIG